MAKYAVGDRLLNALIKQESGGNNNAVSPVGARGVTQVMPNTARDPGYGVQPMRNKTEQEYKRFGREYLGAMLNKYNGDLNLALAAYNAGPGRVDKAGGVPNIPETQNYVKNILNTLNPIGSAEAATGEDDPGDWITENTQQSNENDPGDWVNEGQNTDWEGSTGQMPGIGERALKNLPRDIQNIGQSTIDTVLHPIDTASGLASVVRGGMQSALPDDVTNYLVEKGITPESRQNFKSFIDPLKKDFGSVEGFKEAIAERPASTFLNVSSVLSGAGSLAKALKGKAISEGLQASVKEANRQNALNAPKADVLHRGQQAGLVIPKSEVAPSFANNRLEGFAGKAAMNQESILKNQKIVTDLARKSLGIADDQPLSVDVLNKYRKAKSAPYEEVANLPTQPSLARGYSTNSIAQTNSKQDLFNLRQARNDAQGWYEAAKRSASPDDMKKARQAEALATQLEDRLEQRAIAANKPELLNQLREARRDIAKSYDVEKALNVATGEVDPAIIGNLLDKGSPLTGDLKLIGEFKEAFPKYMKAGEKAQVPGVSKVEAITSLLMGTGGAAAAGPFGALAAVVPLMSTPVRELLLSKPYQRKFVKIAKTNPSKAAIILDKAVNKSTTAPMLANMLNQRQER